MADARMNLPVVRRFGETARRDLWWVQPVVVFTVLSSFVLYATWAALQGAHYTYGPYLSPFYSPEIFGPSEHAWFGQPSWWPTWLIFSPAFFILWGPGGFRVTCYYYRGAYYKAFWADPPSCAVGEPRKSYWGENRWPLLIQNSHRYFMYIACIFLALLAWDALQAFWWPTLGPNGAPNGGHAFGIGLGTVIMVVNVGLLAGFTLGCNSVRHLLGGRLDCFSCPHNVSKLRTGYKLWRFSTWFNEHHMEWAWMSLFSVGFTDFYIRMCSLGIWSDPHIVF